MRRRPLLAAVLGFVGWGLGLVYAGRQRFLGLALFLFPLSVVLSVPLLEAGEWEVGVGAVAASYFLVSLAIAREAYLEAGRKDG